MGSGREVQRLLVEQSGRHVLQGLSKRLQPTHRRVWRWWQQLNYALSHVDLHFEVKHAAD
jgi:hypothetical protein